MGAGVNALSGGAALALLAAAFAAGCAAGPVATGEGAAQPASQAAPAAARKVAPASTGKSAAAGREKSAPEPVVSGWESFEHTRAALGGEIQRRAAALREGPIGNRGAELASRRLAASGCELIDAGSMGGALAALERAVSLDGRNGYAYLWLAVVHHRKGNSGQAAEFAASAGSYLPRDPSVRRELEGLTQSIRRGHVATNDGSATPKN